jgi:hypothetical protein
VSHLDDLSTRRLKRLYLKSLRKTWWLRPHRRTGFARDIGLSKDYWAWWQQAHDIKGILVGRGVDVP